MKHTLKYFTELLVYWEHFSDQNFWKGTIS